VLDAPQLKTGPVKQQIWRNTTKGHIGVPAQGGFLEEHMLVCFVKPAEHETIHICAYILQQQVKIEG